MMDMFVNASALSAFANGMQVTAHNIANVSTNNFATQSYHYRSGPGDRGVEFVGPYGAYNRDTPPPADAPLAQENYVYSDSINNTVDLPREMVHMMLDQRAFEANATTIRAAEETSGVVVNLIA